MKTRRSTKIHKSGYVDEVKDILLRKSRREGFDRYTELINQNFNLDLSVRQVQYFYNHYVVTQIVVPPEESKKAIEKQRELLDVIVEQMDLLELQKKRLLELNDKDVSEMMDEHNSQIIDPEKQRPRSLWYFVREKAKMIREEIKSMAFRINELKEMKKELGLLQKEAAKFNSEDDDRSRVHLDALDDETVMEIAKALART